MCVCVCVCSHLDRVTGTHTGFTLTLGGLGMVRGTYRGPHNSTFM